MGLDPHLSVTDNAFSCTASELSDMEGDVVATSVPACNVPHSKATCNYMCPNVETDLGISKKIHTEASLLSAKQPPETALACRAVETVVGSAASDAVPKVTGHADSSSKAKSKSAPVQAASSTVRNPQTKRPNGKQSILTINTKPDLNRTATTCKPLKPGNGSSRANVMTSVQPEMSTASAMQSDRQTVAGHKNNTATRPSWNSSTKAPAKDAKPSTAVSKLSGKGHSHNPQRQTAFTRAGSKQKTQTMQPIFEGEAVQPVPKPSTTQNRQGCLTHVGAVANARRDTKRVVQTREDQLPTKQTAMLKQAQKHATESSSAPIQHQTTANTAAAVVAALPVVLDNSALQYVPPLIPRGKGAALWRGEVDNPLTKALLATTKH